MATKRAVCRLAATVFLSFIGCTESPREPALPGEPSAAPTVQVPHRVSPPAPADKAALPAPARRPEGRLQPDDQQASIAVLREALASRDYDTRLTAVEALGELRGSDALRWLEEALGDPEPDVRVTAIESLAKIGTPPARRLLASVCDDKTEELRIRALAASALLGKGASQ